MSACVVRALFFAVFVGLIICSNAQAQQPQGQTQTLKLDRVEFKGLEKIKESDALEKSGLQAGQSVTIDDVDAAANRLLASGLFQNLSYQIKGKTDKAVVTFTVVEPKGGLPVAFDNFVWFTDDELNAAVKSKISFFDGTAPEAGTVTEQIKQALQDLLNEHKIEGTVEYNLSSDVTGRKVEHLYSVKGPGLRVCKINYVGARAVPEEMLVQKSGGIFDNDYSRDFVEGFVESNLLPLYRERGYLRAAFSPPKAKPDSTADCEKGVGVTFYVDEGAVYVWDKAAWEGNASLTTQELDAALGMKQREIANVVKIEKGLRAVRKAYGRKGYLEAGVRAAQDFDDGARSVAYRFQIAEGPQYHMGDLTINGLSEVDANNLRGRWRLLHGDAFDEGYPDEFVKKVMPEFVKDSVHEGRPLPPLKVGAKFTPDRDKHTVDVTLDFKPDAPATTSPRTNP
ncbi:MAG TPA: POTRA domain-containing protein [Pyrinomonadaceae bacterium]|nr:POTRA domain-containing protein [Pyrinomonadaceae bacterium]